MTSQCPKCGSHILTDTHCFEYCINVECDYEDIDWDEWHRRDEEAYKQEEKEWLISLKR